MDAKKIKNARMKYLNDLFIDFDKTIPLNTEIEKNIYNLNELQLYIQRPNKEWTNCLWLY